MRSRLPPRSRKEDTVGLSIYNTMSPFMDRGAPMVVIKGGFALGLALAGDDLSMLCFASSLRLSGLATSSTGFFYKVTGRDRLLGVYESPRGLTEITEPDPAEAGRDYEGFVRITSTPNVKFYGRTLDERIASEEDAHSMRGDLGTIIAPEVSIVLYGRLDSLSVNRITQAGMVDGTIATAKWHNKYVHTWPNNIPNGWYASEVHIFDNPQLRGHVSSWTAELFWDC